MTTLGKPAALSRRAFLATAAAFTLRELDARGTLAASDSVPRLLEELTASQRAMRDGGLPFSGETMSEELPDISYDYRIACAGRSRELAGRARRLRRLTRDPEARETLDVLIWDLDRDVGLAPYYWHEFPLSYGSSQLGLLVNLFQSSPPADQRDQYLRRLRQAPSFVETIRRRLLGQLERSLTVPRAEAVRALEACRSAGRRLVDALVLTAERSSADRGFATELLRLARGPLAAALEALSRTLSEHYIPALTETSAVARAENSGAFQRELLRLRIAEDVDPAEQHAAAQDSLAAIDAELLVMRRALGGGTNADAFHASIRQDSRWRARDAGDLATRLNRAAEATTRLSASYFHALPTTPYRVAPLPTSLNQDLLNGYYQPPTSADPTGTYFFNTSGLDVTTWIWAAPLISHELLPGHHLQFARRYEATYLSPYRRSVSNQAFSEGWGEYSRRLMEEAGLYADDPWGLYASRLMDRRFALRTVVETGVFSRTWTWQRADALLATDPLTRRGSSRQIALAAATFQTNGSAYWRGLQRWVALRRGAEARAGAAFDIRDFHEVVMRGDNLPFETLETRLHRLGMA